MSGLTRLREGFLRPPSELGPAPFLFLNDRLVAGEVCAALHELKEQGSSGVFLCPRGGMEPAYLGPEYWQVLEAAVGECARIGLEVWLYDDFNWPSGVAAGELMREHPEFCQQYLDYLVEAASGGATCELAVPPTARPLAARAWRVGSDEVRDLSECFEAGYLRWTVPPGDWQIAVFFTDRFAGRMWATSCSPWTRGEPGALDYLDPDAVAAFIRLTHERYEKHLGKWFGDPIVGFFTDEPATFYGWQWTGSLPGRFVADNGYALEERVHELLFPVGEYSVTRCDFHRVAQQLFVESYFEQIADWTRRHGLKFTGHLLYEDNLNFLVPNAGGPLGPLAAMDVPAADYLGDRTGYERMELLVSPNVGPKTVSSIAHAHGKERALTEVYGGNGWGTSPARYRNVASWISVCGIDFIAPVAAFLSLRGHRKLDHPPSLFVQQPWWRHYRVFSDYLRRLAYVTTRGAHVADVALLYPQHTLWSEHVPRAKTKVWQETAGSFETISTALLRAQRDYDYVFEEMLVDGRAAADNGRLRVRNETFSVVVLPPLTTLPLAAARVLRDVWRGGGHVVAVGRLPLDSERRRDDPNLADVINEVFGPTGSRVDGSPHRSPGGGEARYIAVPEGTADAEWIDLLARSLDEVGGADLRIEAPFARDMIYQHRRDGDADLYLVANLSERGGDAVVSVRASGSVELWDVDTGEAVAPESKLLPSGETAISCRFDPGSTQLLVVAPEGGGDASPPRQSGVLRELELTEWRLEFDQPNCLVLDPWLVRTLEGATETRQLEMRRYDSIEQLTATSKARARAAGEDPTEWTIFMRVARMSGLGPEPWPPPGTLYERSTSFIADIVPDDLAIVYEDADGEVEVLINEQPCPRPDGCLVWDASNRSASIAPLARTGINEVTLRTRVPSYPLLPPGQHGLEPVVLRGSFTTRDGRLGHPRPAALARLESWNELGWPDYSGRATYRARFEVSPEDVGRRFALEGESVHETMEVTVNGTTAGVRLWPPYHLDLTGLVRAGENELEIHVTNTLSNLLMRPLPSGLVGHVRLTVAEPR